MNPWTLLIVPDDGRDASIDLDEPGWAAKHAEVLRSPGTWFLRRVADGWVPFAMLVHEGEEPYYMGRHIGIASAVTGDRKAELIAYGIGKKRIDGHVDRLWILPNGLICTGDDVEQFAIQAIKGG